MQYKFQNWEKHSIGISSTWLRRKKTRKDGLKTRIDKQPFPKVVGPTIRFRSNPETVCSARKEHFLANPNTKQAFVQYLGDVLEKDGCQALHAQGDADTLIARTAVSCAIAINKTTVVIGEDTDLFVLLLHHADLRSRSLLLKSRSKTKKHKQIDILSMKIRLICHLLPFIHAINGCDMTSRLFGVAKGLPLKKIKTDADFKTAAETFCTKGKKYSRHHCIRGESTDFSLRRTSGRHTGHAALQAFREKVTSSITTVQVRFLPPTSAAAKYHSLRVYLQVQDWIDTTFDLQPEVWGWQLSSGRLDPCTTDLPPAPELLLKMIRCNCKSDCRSKRCTCRKHGLECSLACGQCKGIGCSRGMYSPSPEPLADCDD
ncbi:hypothetical protein PoB_002899900 [Plakobranchus ocellatus]|uniref:Tesmin/TSO1-like CXC domain-containing protein n=1 Tax=Plakobranchus ocellatus TaxID=259542 RepID=A0AAV4A487_9GAST|nr:hypothetical protein PoB_002899900 [Plakobranchus ocellatus]